MLSLNSGGLHAVGDGKLETQLSHVISLSHSETFQSDIMSNNYLKVATVPSFRCWGWGGGGGGGGGVGNTHVISLSHSESLQSDIMSNK